MRTLVILPTYNEAENVATMVEQVLAQSPDVDVLVVDDNSPDGTSAIVGKLRETEPRLQLLTRAAKLGLGTAYLAGFHFALDHDYGRMLTMDCDGSHNPAYIPAILDAMATNDVVVGSRYVPGGGIENWPAHRRALSWFANAYARLLLRVPIGDCTSGYRCYSRRVIEGVEPFSIRSSGYSFLEEMVWRVHHAGFRIGEIPIVFVQRTLGVSKIDSTEIYRAAWHVLRTACFPPTVPGVVDSLHSKSHSESHSESQRGLESDAKSDMQSGAEPAASDRD
jgi:dolichol-phosphate mannosyltransferase